MELNEVTIKRAIVDRYFDKFRNNLALDVAIVGGGPLGLVAGYYQSKAGVKTALFERKLSIGGGMWGGGMMYNEIVVQDAAIGREGGRGVDTEIKIEGISSGPT